MVEVIVTDRDGRVVNRVAVNEDLFNEVFRRVRDGEGNDMATAWFLRILLAILSPTTIRSTASASYTDMGGVARTQDFKTMMYSAGSTLANLPCFFNTGYCNNRLWIGYGSSSAPPTRTDFRLGSKLGDGLAGITLDEVGGVITISASFTVSADTTIYEVGLEWEGTVSAHNICGRVLLDRTVFPAGILVRAGQTITIIYRLLLP